MNFERSISAFARAKNVIAGGVNSSVRAFKAVGGTPIFMKSGSGAMISDIDGHEFRLSSLRGSKVVLVSWAPY